MLKIFDPITRIPYLLDTGASVSVVPISMYPKSKKNPDLYLYAANDSKISTYGEIPLNLSLGLRRNFNWNFIVCDVNQAIIGCDFLAKYNLAINISQRTLCDGETMLKVQGRTESNEICNLSPFPVAQTSNFASLMKEFPKLCNTEISETTEDPIMFHHIETTGRPCFQRARRLAPNKLEAVRREIQRLLNEGVIRPSKSEYASPIHVVNKDSGQIRITGDYRLLNKMTKPDRYAPRPMRDFTAGLHNVQYMSKLDIKNAYHNVPVAPQDIKKTAISTPLGLYEFLKTPFGLRNSGSTHARFMDAIFRDLQDFVYIYVDDILIFSKSEEEHLKHLKTVFERLIKYNIKLSSNKCVLGVQELNFLGHRVTTSGIHPTHEKIDVIKNFPKPNTLKELSSFLGLLNFYRPFIPKCAEIIKPLCKLTGKIKKNSQVPVPWSEEADDAFARAKKALAEATELHHPDLNAPLSIVVDTSGKATGAILQQFCEEKGNWKPLAYYSCNLSNSQIKYSTFSRELLGIYKAMKHFRYYIEYTNKLTIFCDHMPIVNAIHAKNLNNHSALHARYLSYILQYTEDIRYVKGKDMIADPLSRISINAISSDHDFKIDYNSMAIEQNSDEELQNLLTNSNNSLELKNISIPSANVPLYCDVSNARVRPYVTKSYRKIVFQALHSLSHPGIRASKKLISDRFLWPGMNKDITAWVKNCLNCCKSKVYKHNKSKIHSIPMPSQKFKNIHIDLVGPLYPCGDYRYLLTIIDRYSKYPQAIPISDISTETVINAFLYNHVANYGIPEELSSDRGSQFCSKLFQDTMNILGIKHIKTTAYNPKSNGCIERFHRQLKASLMCKNKENWLQALPLVLLGIRSSEKSELKLSPAQILYNCELRLPNAIFSPQSHVSNLDAYSYTNILKDTMSNLLPKQNKNIPNQSIFDLPDLKNAPYVFIRQHAKRSLSSPYLGPFRVLRRFSKVFIIERNGKQESVCIDRLKPYFVDNEEINPVINNPVNSYSIPKLNNKQNTNIVDNNATQNSSPTRNYKTRYGRVTKKTIRFQA